MGHFRALGLVVLFVCFSVVLSQAAIEKDGSDREFLKVGVDSSSTYDIGHLIGVFPFDTISVPVYLTTSRAVTEIENWIYWDEDDLDGIDVVPGPGVPAGATFSWDSSNDTLHYNFSVSLSDSFYIDESEPIAYLRFEVLCYGYGEMTDIKFVNQDNMNYYIAGGNGFAPLRDDGTVTTKSEIYSYDLYLAGDVVYAETGQGDIPVDIHFIQRVPGRLTAAWVVLDSSEFQIDSISAYSEYIDSFTWDTNGDTIFIDIPPESNPLLPVSQGIQIFTMHFGMIYCEDGTFDYISFVYGERLDECGNISIPHSFGGQIRTHEFTAEADIAEVQCYNTATYYQVPFDMDAAQPVNKYEFYVNFPADSLEFDSIVNYGLFAAPGAFVTGQDSNIVKIVSGVPTGYHPDDLPSRVFYLKFKRRFAPPVGQVFSLTFNTDPMLTNIVQYFSDYCGYYDASSLTLEAGSITIKQYNPPPPPPPCPTLYVWNGEEYVRENTILAACANGPVDNDVTDYYQMTRRISTGPEGFMFQIREDATETSTFSGFQLLAVDYPEKEPVEVTSDGRIITLGSVYGVAWARDHKGDDITELVGVKDGVSYFSEENGWFDVSFGKLKPAEISNFVAVLSSARPKDPPPILRSGSGDEVVDNDEAVDKKLKVYFKTKTGSWELFAEQDPRSDPSLQATVIDPEQIDSERELVLRYQWEEYYKIDAIEFREARPFDGPQTSLAMTSAVLMKNGTVLGEVNMLDSSEPIVLRPGERIDLVFSAEGLRPIARGVCRDYVFISRGRYETVGEESPEVEESFYALDANYPNPFNPATRIKFNMLVDGHAELRIYDVRGSLVRTLVSGFRSAGKNDVTWDGLSDSGNAVASGVYFYQLKTQGFKKTRKMILLR